MEPKKFEDGDKIIIQVKQLKSDFWYLNFDFQGDTKTDYFYFVMDGEVRFTITDENGEEKEIKVL